MPPKHNSHGDSGSLKELLDETDKDLKDLFIKVMNLHAAHQIVSETQVHDSPGSQANRGIIRQIGYFMIFHELGFQDFLAFKGENRIIFPPPGENQSSLVLILAPNSGGKAVDIS